MSDGETRAAREAEAAGMHRSGFASIVGWTNVGKSTLLNRLVGEKVAAVADVPQTTRNRITGIRTVPGAGQILFVDTPGFHRPEHRMNRAMVDTAQQALSGVDVVLVVFDAARGLGPGDRDTARRVRQAGGASLAVLNKIDRVRPKAKLLPMIRTVVEEWGLGEAFPVSAVTGEGCPELLDRVLRLLPEGPPLFPEGHSTDQPEGALVAEWIREQLVRHLREELPHATAVLLDGRRERQDGLVEIDATILVERESQKGIVIGRRGTLLKRIGTEARRELECLLGAPVFLRLWVKVRPGWRDDDRTLRELGLA